MAIKQTLTLCLLSFLALILTTNGANVAAPPPVDCTTTIMNMAGCLPFVEKGSKTATPDKECCPGFKQVVETDVECLCKVFKQSDSLEIALDYTRALSLPSVCNVTPPFSQCNITLPDLSPPAKSPPTVSPPVESPPTVPPPAKSPPTASPPTKSPPTGSPPVESPPTVPPPPKSQPTASPPTKSPPTVAPAKSPVSPPVKFPVTPVASPPTVSQTTPTASPPAASSVAASPISPGPNAEPSMSTEDAVPPKEKSFAAQLKIHPFTTIVVLVSTILIYR